MDTAFMSEESFPPYKVDILIPSIWAAVEIDGPFHLSKHDKVRDQYLLEHYKLPVLRLKAKKTLWRRKYIEDALKEFISDCTESATQRRLSWLQSQP